MDVRKRIRDHCKKIENAELDKKKKYEEKE